MIRVMIADDHQLFAEGLSQALNILPDTRVVGVVDSGPALEEALVNQPAEVSIVDIEMPGGDGIDTISELGEGPTPSSSLCTLLRSRRNVPQKAGAKGFFSKGVPLVTLAAAVRAVADGQDLISLDDTSGTSFWRPTGRPVSTRERLR